LVSDMSFFADLPATPELRKSVIQKTSEPLLLFCLARFSLFFSIWKPTLIRCLIKTILFPVQPLALQSFRYTISCWFVCRTEPVAPSWPKELPWLFFPPPHAPFFSALFPLDPGSSVLPVPFVFAALASVLLQLRASFYRPREDFAAPKAAESGTCPVVSLIFFA